MRTDIENLDNDYILYFSAPWCAPCKHLKPVMENLSEKYKEVDIFYVDIDKHQELAVEHRIMSVPTVKFLVSGDSVESLTGLRPEQHYEALIQEIYYEA